MMTTRAMAGTVVNDTDLVRDSLAGNPEAFGQIVSRYQSLICSLAYSATGNLGQSEDLAQETFITAWKHLRLLRDHGKLRAWLCGIARNRINDSLRREGRKPLADPEPLENLHKAPAADPLPSEQIISAEEAAMLWRALERLPRLYREPLVLFYREHKSIERVAEDLEVSEDVIKQRLSRGRKLLHQQVLAFVEGALERTRPGKAFTMGVLAALPFYATSASAAVIASTAAKGSTAAKAATTVGVGAAILGPLAAFAGIYLNYRAERDMAGSSRERRVVTKLYRQLFWAIGGFMVVSIPVGMIGLRLVHSAPGLFVGMVVGLVAAYVIAVAAISIRHWRDCRRLAREQGAEGDAGKVVKTPWGFRTRATFLGLPLVHIRIGGPVEAKRKPVKAWIAVGEVALGGLFAFGGFTIAPVSIGGLAIGVLPFGGCAVGLLAMGGFSLGWWAFGGVAVGWLAFGGCALAWKAAVGSLAVGHDYALGAAAYATHFNDAAAQTFAKGETFFQWAMMGLRNLFWLNLLWIIPMMFWWRAEKRGVKRI